MDYNTGKKRRTDRPDKKMKRRTLFLMTVCGIVAFSVLVYKLYTIQIRDHDYYESLAVNQQTSSSSVSAVRGSIFDRNGSVLAISSTTENVFISPYELYEYNEDANLIASFLSDLLDVEKDSILTKYTYKDSWYEVIKKQVDEETADVIRDFIRSNGVNGLKSLHLEQTAKRYYPYGKTACHVIGFVGTDYTGLEGLECYYDDYLSGTDGKTVKIKTAGGSEMLLSDFSEYYDVADGYNVNLTIDVNIQTIVENYLEQAIEINDVQNGAACIAMDPNTCEILAMASFGNYDLNHYLDVSEEIRDKLDLIEDDEERAEKEKEELYRQWRNKAIADTYEPGSVFKTITLAMALEEELVSEEDTFECSGSIEVLGREPVKCWQHSGHGTQTLAEAVQNSCNCAFVTIGDRVGAEKFYEYVKAFGLFDKTGLDVNGEENSIWWPQYVFTDPTNKSQLAAASFGQTFAVTPIQMITAISAACNGGYLMQPYLVSSIEDINGNTISVTEPTVVRQVISNETSALVNEILETVVSEGGGKNAYVSGYHIAGKTGTSEKVKENLTAAEREYVVSFCGYAPADDPQVVVLLLLDTPSHSTGRYISGANMAAPVVGNILSEILDYQGYIPKYSEEDLAIADAVVPNLYLWGESDASGALRYEGLDYEAVGGGDLVTAQYPAPGAQVASGSKVILYMGTEPETKNVTVPDLIGMTYPEAQRRLQNLGLYLCRKSGADSSTVTVGTQYTPVGISIPYGSVIEVALVDSSIQGEF